MTTDLVQEAKRLFIQNCRVSRLNGRIYIPPSGLYYANGEWLWDECAHAIGLKELGKEDWAKIVMGQLLEFQREDGCIPQKIYHNYGWYRKWFDIERLLFKKEHRRYGASTTQNPIIAQAVEYIGDPEWSKKIFPRLLRFYLYFLEKRDPDKDWLISICDPFETRDCSPEFNFYRPTVSQMPILDSVLATLSRLYLKWQYKKLDWDIEKIWEADLFNVEDVMFICLWIDGIRSLIRIYKEIYYEDIVIPWYLKKIADKAENALYELCYDEKDQIFYGLDSRHRKLRVKTIAGIMPIILENIPNHMLQALLEHLENPKMFGTQYPVPTVAVSDPAFDPGARARIWTGQVAVILNWFIIRGLVKHGQPELAKRIARSTEEMVRKEGFREFFHPFSGKGMRVHNYGWSTLVITFSKILAG